MRNCVADNKDTGNYIMVIAGLQKLTLLDFPGKLASTVFTPGCNLRCSYCYNSNLICSETDKSAEYTPEKVLEFLRKRVGKIDGVCVTGGEPLLQLGIDDFLSECKGMGLLTKLDTNGTQPEKLEELIKAGLVDYVAVDMKTGFSRYAEYTGATDSQIQNVKNTVRFLINGQVDYEFRTTFSSPHHTRETVDELLFGIKGAKRYAIQQYRDTETVLERDKNSPPEKEIIEYAKARAEEMGMEVIVRG